jgi:ferric-dicitrate binding protein FerR (iron transport regulator)
MTCLAPERIAELASTPGGDDPHLAECATCRGAVTQQRAIRELVRRLPVAPLPRARREALATEVLARSDVTPMRRALPRRWISGAALGLAAAAGISLAAWPRERLVPVGAMQSSTSEAQSLSVRGVTREIAAPPVDRRSQIAEGGAGDQAPRGIDRRSPTARVDGVAAEFTRRTDAGRDVLALHNGSVTLDARNTRDVDVVARDATIHVDHAKARVSVRPGGMSVTVFAGSVEIRAHGTRQVIEAGMVWTPDDPGPADSLREFRDGWTALRAGETATAIAAFDRAIDPIVAEDAVFWAAVAADRAGAFKAAARRFADFLARFPSSPHAEAARHAIDRLNPPARR